MENEEVNEDGGPSTSRDEARNDEELLSSMNDSQLPKVAKKRATIIRFNETRLLGPKGLDSLSTEFKGYTKKVNKNEFQLLEDVMNKMENWAHCLFPKLTFDDLLDRCERLGHKRSVQNYLRQMRNGEDRRERENDDDGDVGDGLRNMDENGSDIAENVNDAANDLPTDQEQFPEDDEDFPDDHLIAQLNSNQDEDDDFMDF